MTAVINVITERPGCLVLACPRRGARRGLFARNLQPRSSWRIVTVVHRNATLSLDGFRASLLAGLLAAGSSLSCTIAEPEHCANLAGDRTCEARYGAEFQCSQCSLARDGCTVASVSTSCSPTEGLQEHCAYQLAPDDFCAASTQNAAPYCSVCVPLDADAGCVAATPSDDCDLGGDDGTGTGTGTDTDTGTDTSDESTTGSAPECTEADAEVSAACQALDSAAPFCDGSGQCVACDGTLDANGACINLDPNTPICDGGVCVECVTTADCSGDTPICDANSCRACVGHAECPSEACKLASGACFGSDEVRWVDGGKPATECLNADGLTETTALCTLGDAKASLSTTGAIFVLSQAGVYEEQVTLLPGEEFAFLGRGATPPVVNAPGTLSATATVSSATAYFSRIEMSGNTLRAAIACDDLSSTGTSAIYVTDKCVLRLNARYGIEADKCAVHVEDTRVVDNDLGGLSISEGSLSMENTSLAFNGVFGPMNATGALRLANVEIEQFAYNSLVYNQAVDPTSYGTLTCEGSVTGEIRNSILSGRTIESISPLCPSQVSITRSVVDSAALLGGTNIDAGAVDNNRFLDVPNGDLHLSATVPLSWTTAASLQAGDPTRDIDGDSREGDSSAAGVDEPS
jgi:hypothetical protein